MAKIERIEKWMESSEPDVAVSSKKRDKSIPNKSSAESGPTQKSGKRQGASLYDTNNIQILLSEAPDHVNFIARQKIKIEEPKKKGIFKKRNYPELNKLRSELNSLTKDGKIDTYSRQKVRADIKNFPEVPDLHVINAVYTYQDIPRVEKASTVSEIAHNRVLENQQNQLKLAIHEIVLAFYHGGMSVFNINWFMKIYIDYLNVYKSRLTYAYSNIRHRKDKESMTLTAKIGMKREKINQLLEIRERFGGINRVSRLLNGTTYLVDSFSPTEIKKAALAIKSGTPKKDVEDGRTAGKVIAVLMVELFLLAKVPILHHFMQAVMDLIPEEDKSIRLRKRMIFTIMKMTLFQLTLPETDVQASRQAANDLYSYCLETINKHLQTTVLREQFEIDPFLKAVWLVKSADNLFNRANYKDMIKQAYKFIKVIQSENNQLSEKNQVVVVELANKYTYQLDTILDRHGWMGEFESIAWQNRD